MTGVVIVNRKGDLNWQDVPCLEWPRAKSANGYGQVAIGGGTGRQMGIHRFVWQTIHGPTSVNVLHHCDNPPCYEPLHLFAGTQAVNMADAWAKGRVKPFWRSRRTACPNGHSLEGDNAYVRADGARSCRACHREWTRAYRERRASR
jgi:hypothetical protein